MQIILLDSSREENIPSQQVLWHVQNYLIFLILLFGLTDNVKSQDSSLAVLPTTWRLEDCIDYAKKIIFYLQQLNEAQETARQARPEIQNKSVLIKKSEIELKKTKAGNKPVINAGATIASGYSYNQGNFYFVQLGNNFYQSLGITVGIPIYS